MKATKATLNSLRTRIDGIPGAVIVALDKNKIVGTVTISHLNSKAASVTNLFVPLDYRRRGVARKLLDECASLARAHQCQAIGLVVQPKNVAQYFYPRVGFILAYEYSDKSLLFSKVL